MLFSFNIECLERASQQENKKTNQLCQENSAILL